MKKIIIFSILTLAAMSCTKELINQNDKVKVREATESDFVVLGENVKTTLDGLTPKWVEGDVIGITTATDNNIECVLLDETSGYFDGEGVKGTAPFYVVYPYSAENTFSAGVLSASVPTVQTIPNGCVVAPGAMVAAAKSDTRTIGLKNATALLKMTINRSNVKKIRIESTTAGQPLTGKFTFNPATLETTITEGVDAVELVAAGSAFAEGTYYAAVLPGTISGVKITFTNNSPTPATYNVTKTASTTIKRNGVLNFGDFFKYTISNADDLINWASQSAKWTSWDVATLTADIDMTGKTWNVPAVSWPGTFDGNGKTINNLVVEKAGIASFLSECNGIVKNLTLGDGCKFICKGADATKKMAIAAPIGQLTGSGKIEGLVNKAEVKISADCPTTNTTNGYFAAGLVGNNISKNPVSNSVNWGAVTCSASTGTWSDIGGLFGQVKGSASRTISNCQNRGNVTFDGATAGGTINIGGIAGAIGYATEYNADVVNYGSVSVSSTTKSPKAINAAGFAANVSAAITCKANNEGNVTVSCIYNNTTSTACNYCIGGIAGYITGAATFDGCTNKGTIKDESQCSQSITAVKPYRAIGGFGGYLSAVGISVKNIKNYGAIERSAMTNSGKLCAYLSGIIAYTSKELNEVSGCHNYSTGTVTNKMKTASESFLGGIIGYVNGGALKFAISDCVNEAEIKNDAFASYCYIGGCFGQLKSSNVVSKCSNCGNVTDTENDTSEAARLALGGFVGHIASGGTCIFNECSVEGINANNLAQRATGDTKDGVGGFLGTLGGGGITMTTCNVKNVTLANSGTAPKCGMIMGITAGSKSTFTNTGISGSYLGTPITAENLSTITMYNKLASQTVAETDTHFIQ